MFFNEDEIERVLSMIQRTCRNTIGAEIELIVRRFCVARPKGSHSASSSPRAVEDSELHMASELLAFVPPNGKALCRSILQVLATYTMPMEGVEQAVLQIIATSRSTFLDQVK